MMSTKKKRVLRTALALMLSTAIFASVNTSVYSAPSTSELEEKTSDLQGELNDLNSQLSSLSEELDATSTKIEEMSAEVEKAKLDLASAQLNEESQYDSMKSRIQFMYEGGTTSLLETLFSSENMGDFLNKAEYVTTISEYDRSMLEELKEIRASVEKRQKELDDKQKELASLEKDLTAQQEALSSKISSTNSQLSDYEDQLAKAKAAEEASRIAQDNSVSGNIEASSSENSTTTANNGGQTNSGSSLAASTSDVALFAALLEAEAGSSYTPLLAVATVVMNRVESSRYPNTLRGVIYQSGQFSPTWNGALNRILSKGACSNAYAAAQAALGGARYAPVAHCYQFRASFVNVSGINVGGNIFF